MASTKRNNRLITRICNAQFRVLVFLSLLLSLDIFAKKPSPNVVLKNKIIEFQLEKSKLVEKSQAFAKEANSFLGSKDKPKPL